jgi:ribokinase
VAEKHGGVLVAGAINTDLVAWVRRAPAAGETVTGSRFGVFGGGKGANQAVAAARSGARTTMLGAVGRDDFGRSRLADLREEGISTDGVAVVDGVASGVALIIVDQTGENRIAYVPGSTLAVSADQAVETLRRARPSVVLTTLELPPDALLALYQAAREDGVTIVCNAAPEPASGGHLARQADVLIVNETEAAELLGVNAQRDDWPAVALALTRLLEAPGRAAIVTLGADGAIVARDGQTWHFAAPSVKVVDTTGAGDAFCGALAARLAFGAEILQAAEAGVVAGSIAVTREGAQPSMPRKEEIEALLARR